MPFFDSGPDPDFPWLNKDVKYNFYDPKKWDEEVFAVERDPAWISVAKRGDWAKSIIAVGGNLSPGMLLSAYEQGLFPWYNPGDPVLWQSPDPRCVIFPDKLHVSSSMRKILKNRIFEISFDRNFTGVMRNCAETPRPSQKGTWISEDIIEGYTELHRLGYAHSAEAWLDGKLAGGCYGTMMGKAFFGESMFSREKNASKAAFLTLAEKLFEAGVLFIDCQVPTQHLMSLGGDKMSRAGFLKLLRLNGISRYQDRISFND